MANYQVVINPDSDFPAAQVNSVAVNVDNIDGTSLDPLSWWFKIAGSTSPGGRNYHIEIDPDTDFPKSELEKILVDAANNGGIAMNQLATWFKIIHPLVLPNSYHVVINPDTDFTNAMVGKVQVDVDSLLGVAMDTLLTWFKVIHTLSRTRIVINPVDNFVVGSLQDLHIEITNDELADLIADFWFRIGFFWEWVNLQENGTIFKGQLQRFLKLISFSLDEIKAFIANFTNVIDVDRTDADYLPLLAALVGVNFSFEIPIPKQREEIKRAVEIYKTKGTIPAIQRFYRNILGLVPTLEEWPGRILFSNDPGKISAKITTPGEMDQTGLPGDKAFYSLDFSKKGNYRFDKFGIYFYLAQGTGILRAEIEKVLRLAPEHIPASTVGKIIFVDFTYAFTSLGADLSNLWFAFGTGDPAWDGVVVPPTGGETTLENEIYRRQPDGQVYIDGSGYVTETPTTMVRLMVVLAENDSPLNDNYIREQAIFGGPSANGAKDSGTLLGLARFKGQWKTNGYRIRKSFEMSI